MIYVNKHNFKMYIQKSTVAQQLIKRYWSKHTKKKLICPHNKIVLNTHFLMLKTFARMFYQFNLLIA